MSPQLLKEQKGTTLILSISDPTSRNALSPAIVESALQTLAAAAADPGIASVVLRGDGASFCAGGNLQGLAQRRIAGRDAQGAMLDRLNEWVLAMRAFPKPIIAAVEGVAAGAGFSLALACDLIVAAEDARFMLSYGRIGLTPDAGATAHLLQSLPRALVQQWVWLCEPIHARQLQTHGVINYVTDTGHALEEALHVAQRLGAFAPNALATGKALLEGAAGRPLRQQLEAEKAHFIDNLMHPNGGEGLQSFFDKRAARFR